MKPSKSLMVVSTASSSITVVVEVVVVVGLGVVIGILTGVVGWVTRIGFLGAGLGGVGLFCSS